jgi:hypothetical protein
MARKVQAIVTLTDDLDGTKAERTVSFSYDGAAYEIDLSKKNAAALDKLLAPYWERPAGRLARPEAGPRPARRSGLQARGRT